MKSTKKKILVFIDWYLPGYKAGGPIRSCANLIEALSGRYDFWVVCRDRDYLEDEPYSEIEPNKWESKGAAKILYLSPERQTLTTVSEVISIIEPNVIYINGIFSRVFSLYPLISSRKLRTVFDFKIILAPRGMLAPSALKSKGLKKRVFLSLVKFFNLFDKVKFHATNDEENRQISNWFGNQHVFVIENIPGIQKGTKVAEFRKTKMVNELKMYAVARISPEKNIDFALSCLAEIPQDLKIAYRIIGAKNDKSYFRTCKNIVRSLPSNVHVEFLEPVSPIELSDLVSSYDFFFLPTKGENYGHAIIESLLSGIPVLISDQTPWKNLSRKNLGYDLPLDKSTFQNAIIKLARTSRTAYQQRYKEIATKASSLVDVEGLISDYQSMYDA